MKPFKIENVFIEIVTNFNGDIIAINDGKFIQQEFKVNNSIYDVCPFLIGTLDGISINESAAVDGMLIVVGNEEFNVDIELFKQKDSILILIHNRTKVYNYISLLNQNRNDLFFLKREIAEKNKELERLKDIADKANEAKSRFLAMMSHEVRNPLNVILNYTDLIKQEKISDKVEEYTKYLTVSGKNLKVIVDDILDLSRVEAGKLVLAKESISLKTILNQIENNYNTSIKDKKIDLIFSCSEYVPNFVFGDDVRIYQIITNLVNNSIKFTPKGFVKTEIVIDSADHKTTNIIFKISDSGRGMTKEQASNVFEEYQQNQLSDNRIHKGAGLGLSIVKRLVSAMNGSISIESEVEVGTTFNIKIPFNIDFNNDVNHKKEIKYAKNSIEGKKILVADDNYLNLTIVSYILKKEKADFTFAKDGIEALSAMKKENFDMVMLDINMPNLTGEDLIKQKLKFENNNSKIPFLALTANNSKEDIEGYLSIGFDDVIPKPFTPSQFLEILKKYI